MYGPGVRGTFYKYGLIIDLDSPTEEDGDDEWKNVHLRESIARSSLIRCRHISSTTYFSKGKLNELGLFIKDNSQIQVVFINSSLTSLQLKKLQKRWNDILLDREERLRQYNLKSALKENPFSPTESDTTSAASDLEGGAS